MSSVPSKQSTVCQIERLQEDFLVDNSTMICKQEQKIKGVCRLCISLLFSEGRTVKEALWHRRLTKRAGWSVLWGKNGSAQALSFPTIAVLTTELMSAAEHILTPSPRDRSYKYTGEKKLWISFLISFFFSFSSVIIVIFEVFTCEFICADLILFFKSWQFYTGSFLFYKQEKANFVN